MSLNEAVSRATRLQLERISAAMAGHRLKLAELEEACRTVGLKEGSAKCREAIRKLDECVEVMNKPPLRRWAIVAD